MSPLGLPIKKGLHVHHASARRVVMSQAARQHTDYGFRAHRKIHGAGSEYTEFIVVPKNTGASAVMIIDAAIESNVAMIESKALIDDEPPIASRQSTSRYSIAVRRHL
jgi:hypothetical protein